MNLLRAGLRAVPLCAVFLVVAGPKLFGRHDAGPQRHFAVIAQQGGEGLPHPALDTLTDAAAAGQREKAMARLGVENWHQSGTRGQGIKIAVLDSGFRDYRSFLGTALPGTVKTKSFRLDENLEGRDSQHGILCGEVIHTLAPEAELLFVNWEPERPDTFLQAVVWAREQGAKVLSCSLIMPSWSDGEGGGEVNQALAQLVGGATVDDAMLFFASAGNLAQRHWSGPEQRDAAGYHQWAPEHRNNILTPWGDERVSVELYGQGSKDLELQVFQAATATQVGHCRSTCEGSPSGCPCAVVRFQPEPGSQYYVRVRCDKFAKTGRSEPFHLVVLGGALHYSTASGSISFPGDGPSVLAVGAVDNSGNRLSYSSCGPNSKLPKPDYVAAVPFPSIWRERPFAGTSAAAPQAAALAALLWSRHLAWTAREVNQALRQASFDLGPMGHDWETGHGLLRLPPVAK